MTKQFLFLLSLSVSFALKTQAAGYLAHIQPTIEELRKVSATASSSKDIDLKADAEDAAIQEGSQLIGTTQKFDVVEKNPSAQIECKKERANIELYKACLLKYPDKNLGSFEFHIDSEIFSILQAGKEGRNMVICSNDGHFLKSCKPKDPK